MKQRIYPKGIRSIGDRKQHEIVTISTWGGEKQSSPLNQSSRIRAGFPLSHWTIQSQVLDYQAVILEWASNPTKK